MPNWTSSTPELIGSPALSAEFLVRVPGAAPDGSQDTIAEVSGTSLLSAGVGSVVQGYSPLLTNIAGAGLGYVFVISSNTISTSNTIPSSAITGNISGSTITGNISGNSNNITGNLSSNQITIGLGFTPAKIDLTNVNWATVSNTVLTNMFNAMSTAGLFTGFLGS